MRMQFIGSFVKKRKIEENRHRVNITCVGFLIHRKVLYELKKPSGQDRTAAVRNYVAKATRRRRRISQARFFLISRIRELINELEISLSNFAAAYSCWCRAGRAHGGWRPYYTKCKDWLYLLNWVYLDESVTQCPIWGLIYFM